MLGPIGAVAEPPARAESPLCYYPALSEGRVLVNTESAIMAVAVAQGQPLWGGSGAIIYREQSQEAAVQVPGASEVLGTPRFTLTVFQDRLYAQWGPW